MSKKHRIAVLRETITKVTRILAGRGIRVTQSGMNAFVQYHEKTLEPIRVNVPYLPDDASDELISAIEGFVDHEVGHLLFSIAEAIREATKKGVPSLHNIVEDVFIERKMAKQFSGSAYNLSKMYIIFTEKFIQPKFIEYCRDSSKTEMDYWNLLCACSIRALGGQEHFVEYMADKWALLPKVKEAIEPFAKRIQTSEDTWENLEIAVEMRDALYGKKEEPKEEEPEDSGEPDFDDEDAEELEDEDIEDSEPEDEEPEEGKSEEEGEDIEDSDPEEEIDDEEAGDDSEEEIEDEEAGDESDPEAATEETIEKSGDSDGVGGGESEVPEEDGEGDKVTPFESDDPTADMAEIKDFDDGMSDLISEMAGESRESGYIPFTKEWDRIEEMRVPEKFNERWITSIESKVDGMTGTLQKGLERAFKAANRARWEGGKKSGRINSAALSRLLNNDPRVFRTREEMKTKEVAVTLLIDCSGSMSGNRINVATESAWALSEVLSKLGINYEVLGFTTTDEPYRTEEYKDMAEEMSSAGFGWSRLEPIYMPVMKAFGERWGIPQKRRLASVPRSLYLANNVDGECVQYAADRLLRQKEPGKTLIVLSDGAPCACGSTHGFVNHLRSTIKDLSKKINIVGIGIQTNAVRDYYKNNVVINDVNDLPNVVMSQLRDAIMQK